jgi:hypothetical protein
MNNVFQSFQPFYYLSKLLGLLPLTVMGNSFKFTWMDAAASVGSLGFLLALTYFIVFIDDGPYLTTEMLSMTWRVHSIIGLHLTFIEFLIQMRKTKAIPKFINKLRAFDDKV